MMRKLFFCSLTLSASLTLTGCNETGAEFAGPAPVYSPDYTYIRVVSEDGRSKRVLVPEACLEAPANSQTPGAPARVPPGCANNYNLQRMVERERDLTYGRRLTDAPAEPAARAARNYIYGEREPVFGGGISKPNVTGSGEVTNEAVQTEAGR